MSDRDTTIDRRNVLKATGALFGTATAATATGVSGAESGIEPGVYRIRNVNSDKVADVDGISEEPGASVLQWENWDDPGNQTFEFETLPDGSFRITAQHSGHVLTADGGAYGNLVQQTWDGSDRQRWTVVDADAEGYRIENVGSGHVLDVEGGSTEDGANILLYTWHGGANQRWNLERLDDGDDGDGGTIEERVYELENVKSGKLADVAGVSEEPGANVHQWEDWDDPGNQEWDAEHLGDGEYRLTAQHSDLALTVEGGETDSAVQQPWEGSDTQRWRFESTDDEGYKIVNVRWGTVLDVYYTRTTNGADIHLWTYHGGPSQRWRLNPVEDPDDGDPQAPTASFDVSTSEPAVGQSVEFDASASNDPDGSIESYSWEFGDGETAQGAVVSHSFNAGGNYQVGLTVTDDDGQSDTATETISVGEREYLAQSLFYGMDDPSVNRETSKHFQIVWGDQDSTGNVDQAFVEGNLQNLERIWDTYVYDMGFAEPAESFTDPDGNRYKVNLYITETGLSEHESGWAFAGSKDGYGHIVIHPDAMRVDPPSWTTAHEFGHVVTMHQGGGWNDNGVLGPWWEAAAEFFAENYIYSDNYRHDGNYYNPDTGFCGPQFRHSHLYPAHSRMYYDSWPILQYVRENPDGLADYGDGFVPTHMQDSRRDENFFEMLDRLAPNVSLQDTLGHYAKRMATQDFEQQDIYQDAFDDLLNDRQSQYETFTELEPSPDRDGWWRVPIEHAPQQGAFNLIELDHSGGTVTVDFDGIVDPARGSDWRVALVAETSDGTTYSDLWNGGTESLSVSASAALYLVVIATPEEMLDSNAFASGEDQPYESHPAKARFPYEVAFSGATPRRTTSDPPNYRGSRHPNGGGFVANSASGADSAFVGPNALVLDDARVEGSASVRGYAIVKENATVAGEARVLEHAVVKGDGTVRDQAVAKGSALVLGGTVSGDAVVDGDYTGDLDLDSGTVFNWLPDEDYATSKPSEPGLYLAYDFEEASDAYARDRYGVNHGILRGGASVSSGTLELNGSDQYVLLEDHVLDGRSRTIEVRLRWAGGASGQRVWALGASADRRIYLTPSDESGTVAVHVEQDGVVRTIDSDASIQPGEWTTIAVTLADGTGEIRVDGSLVGRNTNVGVTPGDLRIDDAVGDPHENYIGRGVEDSAPYFDGAISSVEIYR